MESVPQQKTNKSSVLSLLNPVNEDLPPPQTSKRNFEEPSIEYQRLELSSLDDKKKRPRILGEIDAVHSRQNSTELFFTGRELEHFTSNLQHANTQQYHSYHHNFLPGIPNPTQDNNNNYKHAPSITIEPPRPELQRTSSIFDYFNYNQQYQPSLPSCNQLQPAVYPPSLTPLPTPSINPCSLPSILNPPQQSISYQDNFHTFAVPAIPSNTYNYFSGEQQENPVKKNPTTSPTYQTNPSHKHRTVLIQPSSQDPPIEAKLIVDDPKTNPFTQQWMEHFQELKAFKEKHGHTNVTRSITGYYNLGNWVAEQRRKFKQGKITESQFNCLNQIGFEWDRSYYFFRTRHRKKSSEGNININSDHESPRTD